VNSKLRQRRERMARSQLTETSKFFLREDENDERKSARDSSLHFSIPSMKDCIRGTAIDMSGINV
jgi:hypothetical protein